MQAISILVAIRYGLFTRGEHNASLGLGKTLQKVYTVFTMKKETTENNTDRPEIYSYRDARLFVADLCTWKKCVERGFSYRKLVQLADLGSPGYIQTYLSGARNLAAPTAHKLAEALLLSTDESEYFVILVAFTQAEENSEKTKWLEQLLQLAVRKGTGQLDAARLSYFTDWYIPAIHTMASLEGFKTEPAWIAGRLNPSVPVRDVRRAIDILVELGIFVNTKEGLQVKEARLKTHDKIQSLWIREYHRSMIRLAERAIDSWPRGEHALGALTVTVPEDKLKDVFEWMSEYRSNLFAKILMLSQGKQKVHGRVVQFNFQGFPLTEAPED